MLLDIIGWMIAGLIIGAIGRLFVPGRQAMGLFMTMILGICGAFVGGIIGSALFGPREGVWPGWFLAILGGVLVVWIYAAAARRRV